MKTKPALSSVCYPVQYHLLNAMIIINVLADKIILHLNKVRQKAQGVRLKAWGPG